MFVAQALYPFSSVVINSQQNQSNRENDSNKNQQQVSKRQLLQQKNYIDQKQKLDDPQRLISKSQKQLNKQKSKEKNNQVKQLDQKYIQSQKQKSQQTAQIQYLTFQKGQKLLVIQAYQNGWWYGNTIKNPQIKGFFPSNYVKIVGQHTQKSKPPPPPPSQSEEQQQQFVEQNDSNDQNNAEWVKNELKNITRGPVQSAYYLGIKGYKNVKIDQKNSNILKGDHVKFDVNTGLAKVPVKDQAPAAKAVRQMGYYFDYHQWCEQRNKKPDQRSRPDPKRKKIKKLNLKGMK